MNDQLSKRINSLPVSETLAMAAKARELKEQGKNIISLSLGEPDFNTPDFIKDAAIDAIHNNYSTYSPVDGYLDLKQAICRKFKRDNNVEYKPSQIVVSTGAKQSIANAAMVLLNPGDEVLLPAPYWVSYVELVKLAEGKNVVIIGGGDTANDCVATAISQGAKSVKQLEIASKNPDRKKNSYDFNEDEVRLYQSTAVKFIESDGCVSKIVTDEVEFSRGEKGSKLEFKNQHGEIEADLVFVAIGFLGPVDEALAAFDVELDRSKHNRDTQIFTTDKDNIFICGDARRGQSLIKWAIGEGKMAALTIEDYLKNKRH